MSKQKFIVHPKTQGAGYKVDLWLEEADFAEAEPEKKRGRRKTEPMQPVQGSSHVITRRGAAKLLPLLPPSEPDTHAPHGYLILGFDTEYKSPDPLTLDEIRDGKAKFEVLSYQFHAKTSEGLEWSGICLPEADERITLEQFLLFALASGARRHGVRGLPRNIYLVGHFTRADIPAFKGYKDSFTNVDAIRGTFATLGASSQKMELECLDGSKLEVKAYLRDTMLLTPQASKSLKELGKLVDLEKVELSEDRAVYKDMIRNMDKVRSEQWDLFKRYALTDAEICVRYLDKVIRQNREVTGTWKVPLTLSGIGVDLIQKHWRDSGHDPLAVVGKELVKKKTYSQRAGRFNVTSEMQYVEALHAYEPMITECYHGGRNEQFWFGPGFKGKWSDIDLSSAYPTAMAMINYPQWDKAHPSTNIKDYMPETLGFAVIEFSFPDSVRYPTIPVRTEGGLVFPRRGRAHVAAPEVRLAKWLGAEIKIIRGVVIPQKPDTPVFRGFIRDCIKKRMDAGKTTLEGLFWKEISNSTYGKMAQGLRPRRIFDMRSQDTKPLEPSVITNCAFAAYTTSLTRAILGELMNALPPDKIVFSCTTDGFITNATDADINHIVARGKFTNLYAWQREELVDSDVVVETKHEVLQPLGWRVRGQATLKAGKKKSKEDGYNIVLARAGVYIKPEFEGVNEQNEEIVKMFFNRFPDSYVNVYGAMGLREMIENDADFVGKELVRRLSMEYDWKRKPGGLNYSKQHKHIAFSTVPWDTVDEYNAAREAWQDYTKDDKKCLKSLDDFRAWAKMLFLKTSLEGDAAKFLRKENGDLQRLRKQLCSAFVHKEAGVTFDFRVSRLQFAELLTKLGMPCKKYDLDNEAKVDFVPQQVPPTDDVMAKLAEVKHLIPTVVAEQLLYQTKPGVGIDLMRLEPCQFTQMVR